MNLKSAPETVLASQEELMGHLARIATPATRHSAHERQSAMLAREAFWSSFSGVGQR